MTVNRKKDTAQPKVFLHKVADVPGGASVKASELGGEYLAPGTPIGAPVLGKCSVCKFAEVVTIAANDATDYEVKKGHHFKVGDFVTDAPGSKAYAITVIDKTNDTKDKISVGTTLGVALAVGAFLYHASAQATTATSGGTKGVYTLTIGTNATADDTLTINGTDYVFAAEAAEGKIALGATATATAANLQDTVEHDNPDFLVKSNGAKLVFTQRVPGTGAIPIIGAVQTSGGSGGTLAASIAQTTPGVAPVTTGTSTLKVVAQSLVGTGCVVDPTTNIATDAILIGVTSGNALPSHLAATLPGIINI